jgi:hypothetical protein
MHSDEHLVLMPVLARGNHVHPRVGGCFAEVAAILTTHQWTDHPACLPPVLAEMARAVNDLTSPDARTALAPLVPWAISGPRPSKDLTADIAVTTALMDLTRCQRPGDPSLAPLLQRLQRRPRTRHVLDRIAWRRAARHLVRAQLRFITATTGGSVRDDRLRALLITAIDSNRAVEDLPPLPQPAAAPMIGTHLLPVTAHPARVDEVFELHVEPLIDGWPDWIRDPWDLRLHELSGRPVTDGARDLVPV